MIARLWLWSLLSVLILYLHTFPPAPWQQLSFFIQDSITRHWVMPLPDDSPVVLVDIDETSIDLMGAWPWSRALVANLLDRLADDYQVSVMGLDIVFPEEREAEEDRALSASVARLHPIVAVAFDYVGQSPPLAMGQVPTGLSLVNSSFAYPAYGFIANYPALAVSAEGGHISPLTDDQGLVRYMPPFVSWQHQLYPSLALALLARWQEKTLMPVQQHQLLVPWVNSSYQFTLTDKGLWQIPYRYPLQDFTLIPAWQVLSEQVPAELLRHKIVIIGSSALGLSDRFATPLAPMTPGMLVHAQMLSSLLLTSGKHLPSIWIWTGLVFVLWILSMTVMKKGLKSGLLVVVFSLTIWLFFVQYVYQQGVELPDMGSPILFVLLWFLAHSALEWSLVRRKSEQMYQLFRDYLPPHLLTQVVKHAERDVLTPKHQDVTVLFADISGFTKMTESMSTPEVVQLTRRVLSLLTEAVYETDGTLDKYMGDALMAFWNAPVAQPNHRSLAVQAALKMREALQQLNEARDALDQPPIVVRIGINTGDVLVGDLGTKWRHAYTVMGDTVNIAQRLMLVAGQLTTDIVIGEKTAGSLQIMMPTLMPIGAVRLLGKEQPVSVFVIPITKVIEEIA